MDTKKKIKKDLSYYLNLPWTYTVETAHEQGQFFYIIRVAELPEICTDAPTLDEAMHLIKEPMTSILEFYLEDGQAIPEPKTEHAHKPRITYQGSIKKEDRLIYEAKKRNLSLNEYLNALAEATFQK